MIGPVASIEFIEVGRTKRSWTANVPADFEIDLLADFLWTECKRTHALMSDDLSATVPDDSGQGCILAGLFTVGRHRILEVAKPG